MKFIDLPPELMPTVENYDPEVAQLAETVRCHIYLNVVQDKPGRDDSKVKTDHDRMVYTEAMVIALKIPVNFQSTTLGNALQSGDQHVFDIFKEALADIERAKEGIPHIQQHAAALLAAKLDAEKTIRRLPTRKLVKANALRIFRAKFNVDPYPHESYKQWDRAFTVAGLDYLK